MVISPGLVSASIMLYFVEFSCELLHSIFFFEHSAIFHYMVFMPVLDFFFCFDILAAS